MSFRVRQFSIPRSGSTFTQQVFWILAGKNNVLTYHVIRPEINVIVYRNFIDAFMSYFRVQTDQDDYFIDDPKVVDLYLYGPGPKDGSYIIYINSLFWFAGKLNGKLVLEYETDIVDEDGDNRYDHLVKKIGGHFNREFTDEDIARVREYCSVEANKKRSQEQGSWHNVNREHNIHGRHIWDPKPGDWREHCSEEVENYLLNSELNTRYKTWRKIVGH